jgi:hypothetical protein
LLAYIAPLNKAIAVLLQSQTRGDDEEEFERNFKDVMFEYLEYYKSVLLVIREEHLGLLLKKSFSSTGVDLATQSEVRAQGQTQTEAEAQTPLEQTLNHATRVIANSTRLMLEPDYQAHLLNHPGVLERYKELMAYVTILSYIINNKKERTETDIEQSMVEKIIRKCQEAAWNVEGYVDTIEIDADPDVPNAILSVFPATKVSVSNGSNIYCQSVGNFPSVVPGYGSCGLIDQINLSKTHKESKPAFSAPFARLMIFSFVVWPSPVCGSLSPIFTSLNTL